MPLKEWSQHPDHRPATLQVDDPFSSNRSMSSLFCISNSAVCFFVEFFPALHTDALEPAGDINLAHLLGISDLPVSGFCRYLCSCDARLSGAENDPMSGASFDPCLPAVRVFTKKQNDMTVTDLAV